MRVVGQEPRAALVAVDQHGVDAGVGRKEEHLLARDPQDRREEGVDHAAVHEQVEVALAVLDEDHLDRGAHAGREIGAGLGLGREVPGRLLGPEQVPRVGVLVEDLREVLELPSPAVPLAEVLALDHVDARRARVRAGGLLRASERGRVDGGRRREVTESRGERLGLLAPGGRERRVERDPAGRLEPGVRGVVGLTVPDQVEALGHAVGPVGTAAGAGFAGCRARQSAAYASTSSRSQIRPEASDVIGSGNEPRSM